jgi:hypothetical protein
MKAVRIRVLLAAALAAGVPLAAMAQTPAGSKPATSPAQTSSAEVQQVRSELERLRKEFEALRRQYDDRLFLLEQRLSQIGGGPMTVAIAQPQDPLPPPVVQAQVGPGASKVFNPDNSIIANFVGAGGKNPLSTQPSLQMTEVEAAFQAAIDPYARADFFLAAGPEGLEVEEGFMTFTTLPGNLLLKVGKMRAQFGKVNTLHTHLLPTADRPLVTDNLVGGEEGISDAGLSLSHLITNPHLFLEVTGEVFRGGSEVFQSEERSKLNYVGRVRAYRDLTESANIDLGTSFAFGPTDVGMGELLPAGMDPVRLNKSLFGIDATFRYRPLRRAIYHRLNLRTELIWSRQDLFAGEQAKAFGFYGLGEYQFARRWYIGARLDRSGRTLDGSLHDNGGSVFLTFWPSEFSQIRGQFRHVSFAEGIKANEFLFQFNFAIGAHGAHVF